MSAHNLAHAVDRPRVQAVGLVRRVLHLQARLDVLDGRRDEADGAPRERARDPVAQRRQPVRGRVGVRASSGGRRRVVITTRRRQARGEDVVGEKAAIDVQGAQHARRCGRVRSAFDFHCAIWIARKRGGGDLHRVHEHPAHERRGRALVETPDAFIADSLEDAVERPAEARFLGGLEADFDGVKAVPGWLSVFGSACHV